LSAPGLPVFEYRPGVSVQPPQVRSAGPGLDLLLQLPHGFPRAPRQLTRPIPVASLHDGDQGGDLVLEHGGVHDHLADGRQQLQLLLFQLNAPRLTRSAPLYDLPVVSPGEWTKAIRRVQRYAARRAAALAAGGIRRIRSAPR